MANKVDWTGKRVGNLSVIREESSCRWKVRCDCGNEKVIASGDLARGQKNGFAVCKTWCHYAPKRYSRVKHGHYKSPEYGVWHRMKDRCYLKSNPSYMRYGGRGITVCKRWKDDFRKFLEDMGKMPEPGMSVDRINNDKGYSPSNCRWATPKEQANNRNSNVLIDTPWGRMTISQASEKSGIPYGNLLHRVKAKKDKGMFRPVKFQNEKHNTKWGVLTTKEACAKAGISPKLAWSRMARGISNPDEIFTTDDLRINKR